MTLATLIRLLSGPAWHYEADNLRVDSNDPTRVQVCEWDASGWGGIWADDNEARRVRAGMKLQEK